MKEIKTHCSFMICTDRTEEECLKKGLFGDQELRLYLLKSINKGDIVFLLNVERNQLLGIFIAESEIERNIDPCAWGGKYPAQLKVKRVGELQRVDKASEKLEKIIELKEISRTKYSYSVPAEVRYGPDTANEVLSLFKPIGLPKDILRRIEDKARLAEERLRNIIMDELKRAYGSDKWWKQGLPEEIRNKAEDRWKDEKKRNPYLRNEEERSERKFEFLGLGEMIDIVKYGQNWEQAFKEVFLDKEILIRCINDIMDFRNPSSHVRTIEYLSMYYGIGGLLWLSGCIGDRDLVPSEFDTLLDTFYVFLYLFPR